MSSSASPDRLRVGECLVVLSSREIRAPGARRPLRVTPKALAVLRVLVEQPGRVVSREALLAQVWSDTLPTNDVVTQAVTQLRKAFGAGGGGARDGHAYIETIAKTGYRLLAAVEWLDEPEAESAVPPAQAPAAADAEPIEAPPPAPVPRLRSLREILGASVLAAVGVAVLAGVLFARGAETSEDEAGAAVVSSTGRPYRLITSAPGFEVSPSLSPDASQVAYAATLPERGGATVIMVQPTDNAPPRQLSDPGPLASDRFPAWSPDGRDVAFARFGPGDECRVLLAPANGGGAEREVTRCDGADMLSFSWTPDGRGLVFGTMTGRYAYPGIRVLELATGAWKPLDYAVEADDFDYMPRYSPDGKWIAFARNPQLGDLWRVPAEGGRPEPLTEQHAEIRGWSWLPDSRGIVFGRRVDSQTRLYRVDVDSGEFRDLGLDDVQAPDVSADTGTMAFMYRRPQFGLFRIEREPEGGGPPRSERLFASLGRDIQPIVSPDGHQIVFSSDRSGRYQLWWADLSRPDSLRPVEGLHPETRQPPDWSADGRRVLVSGWDSRGHPGIYEVEPEQGRVRRLPVPAPQPLQAVYLPDPERLLVGAEASDGRPQLILYDRSRTPWRPLRTIAGVSQVRFDPVHGRVLFTRLAGGGLWEAAPTLEPASIRRIDATMPSRWRYRTWAVGSDGGIEYLHAFGDCLSRLARIGDTDPTLVPPRCLADEHLSNTNGFSVDARNGVVYVALAVEDGTDIGFMALPDELGRTVSRKRNWLILKANRGS